MQVPSNKEEFRRRVIYFIFDPELYTFLVIYTTNDENSGLVVVLAASMEMRPVHISGLDSPVVEVFPHDDIFDHGLVMFPKDDLSLNIYSIYKVCETLYNRSSSILRQAKLFSYQFVVTSYFVCSRTDWASVAKLELNWSVERANL